MFRFKIFFFRFCCQILIYEPLATGTTLVRSIYRLGWFLGLLVALYISRLNNNSKPSYELTSNTITMIIFPFVIHEKRNLIDSRPRRFQITIFEKLFYLFTGLILKF